MSRPPLAADVTLQERPNACAGDGERGVALVVVLMFLLVLTSLAVFSARYATLGESMARNQLDQERARQAAEAALRDAERDLLLPQVGLPPGARCDRTPDRPVVLRTALFSADCVRGQCAPGTDVPEISNWNNTAANAEVWWPASKQGQWNNNAASKPRAATGTANCAFTGGVPVGTFTGAAEVAGVARQPEYLIEYFQRGSGRGADFFRITARGFGQNATTEVVLQSYFQPYIIQ
jgi:type IV pilus assembly protein PilX